MNTLYLRYAVEIEKTGSISQAAHNLYMGQPNLSKSIRELEASLGITIFHRSPKGVRPTREGSEFLTHARKVLAQVEEMQACCHAESRRPRFSLMTHFDGTIIGAFADFIQRLPEGSPLDATLRYGGAADTIDRVDEGEADMGVIRFPMGDRQYYFERLREKELVHVPLFEFEYRLLFSSRHLLAKATEISREQLAPYIEICDQEAAEDTAPGNRRLRLPDQESPLHYLSLLHHAYAWSAPQPGHLLDSFGLVQRHCAWRQQRHGVFLIRQREHQPNQLEQTFIDSLKVGFIENNAYQQFNSDDN